MRIITHLSSLSEIKQPLALTIGNFDGVHLGHQAVLHAVKDIYPTGQAAVVTFSNHPATILRPSHTPLSLCTTEHKLKLLEAEGIDILILLNFTKEFAKQSAEEFITTLRAAFPFQHLILGHDATIGKERHGDPATLKKIAEKFQFTLDYVPQLSVEGNPVSSSRIRQLIQQGDLLEAKKMLGRPFSIYQKVSSGQGRGKALGFATANLEVEGLCLPPLGVYAVEVLYHGKSFFGVANLGKAPTLNQNRAPLLEVHLFEPQENWYEKEIEVIFYQFIRPEKHFSSPNELKNQIAHDVTEAKRILLK